MTSYRTGDRAARCIVAAVAIGGFCCVCVLLSSHWLDVERRPQVLPSSGTDVRMAATDEDDPARNWFPAGSWVHSARKSFRDGMRHLFVNDVDPGGKPEHPEAQDQPGQTFTLSPIAVLWESEEPGEVPITATASAAEVRLSDSLSIQESSIGRIVSGVLTGDVQIRGPKNLRIDGREFFIDEKSMKLRSRQPISFAWEDHVGHASGGIEIQLSGDATGDSGLLDISDVTRVQLNGRVKCDLVFRARRVGEEDVNLEITAATGFEYDVQRGLGSFHGHGRNRDYTAANQVLVRRMTEPGAEPDLLQCSRLDVEFHPEISPDTGQAVRNRRQLGRVSAQGQPGQPVVYLSRFHQIRAMMSQLHYFVGEQRLEMQMAATDDIGSQRPVRIWQKDETAGAGAGGQELLVYPPAIAVADNSSVGARNSAAPVATVRIFHGDGNVIERVECIGRGMIQQQVTNQAPDGPVPAAVRWNRRLTVQREPDGAVHKIQLTGGGHITLPRDGLSLSARTIDFWVNAPSGSDSTGPDASGSGPSPKMVSLDLADAEPRLLKAEGAVIIQSPQANGELRNRLTVQFQPPAGGLGDHAVHPAARTTDRGHSGGRGLGQTLGGSSNDGATDFSAKEMEAYVTLVDGKDASWERIQMRGEVTVRRTAADQSEEFTASGNVIVATNGPDAAATMHLFGDPAEVKSPGGYVEGARIDLDQSSGTAEINGSGRIRIVTDKDLDGTPLPEPVPMDIFWTDFMHLEGAVARFVGNIRVVTAGTRFARTDVQTHDIELNVPEMIVHFTRPIRLAPGGNDELRLAERQPAGSLRSDGSGTPDLERIECVGHVVVNVDSHEDGRPVSQHTADLVDLTVNMETGDFEALGPGWIESTNPSDTPQLQVGSAVRAQANTPTEIRQSAFARVRASFIGQLQGNMRQQNVTMFHHVTAVFAPVQELDEELDLESMSADAMPDESGLLRAEEMVIDTLPGSDAKQFSVTARENARLESRRLSGDADVITFDSSKEQYILSANNDRTLTVHHRPGGTGRYQTVYGRRFEYYRRSGELKASVSTVQATD